MTPDLTRALIIPATWPLAVPWALTALGAVAWLGSHRLRRPSSPRGRAAHFLFRSMLGLFALALAADAAQQHLVLATPWSLWFVLAAGSLAVEAVIALTAWERSSLPVRPARALLALRVLLALALTAMLCQPVRVVDLSRKIQRSVAILIDDSASMRIADTGMTGAEKVRLAEILSVKEAVRPCPLDRTAAAVRAANRDADAQVDWMSGLLQLPPADRERRFDTRARTLKRALNGIRDRLAAQTNTVAAAFGDTGVKPGTPAHGKVTAILTVLTKDLPGCLDETRRQIDALYEKNKDRPADVYDRIQESLRRLATLLKDLEPRLHEAGTLVDELFYDALPAESRAKVDRSALRKRSDLARDLLLHHRVTDFALGRTRDSLLERLQAQYGLRVYTFASEPVAIDPAKLGRSPEPEKAAPDLSILPSGVQRTDLAAALERVTRDLPADRTAGILILTDGRHNAAGGVEPVARSLGLKQIPVCPVVFGSGLPPRDAGIVDVDAPQTVYTNDRIYISATIKLDGLAGSNALVSLYRGAEVVATSTVAAAGDSLRLRVQLGDEPRTNGLHLYRLAVREFANEVTLSNNTVMVPVIVTDDRVRLLLLEGRPRWEFRFLKNLFSSRDSSVGLQHLLFHPDTVTGMPPPDRIAASASRPPEETEATALPASADEWMKFDTIILGDVDPSDLGEETGRTLQRFVADRGGTLIVIAGPMHMPHAYGNTPLSDLLPVTVTAGVRPVLAGPERSYRIRLTPEGRDHILTRLAVDRRDNDAAWAGLPECYWRHAVTGSKEGATVLAYAWPDVPPDYLQSHAASEVPDEATLRLRHRFQRDNPLIATHHVGLGRVVYLSFDQTWRLRYRVGDRDHHRFWGQMLRWGAGSHLPFGTRTVRLGTDRSRYRPEDRIRVEARILRPDFSPVLKAGAAVQVYRDGRRILRKSLELVPDSAGVYATDLENLPVGDYRIELDSAEARRILAADQQPEFSGYFSVLPVLPGELVELSADRGLLSRLASLTGGRVLEPADLADPPPEWAPPATLIRERRQIDLWASWPFFLLVVGFAALEWTLRKKVNLP